MFDFSSELDKYRDLHLELGGNGRKQLAGFRDANLERLRSGLDSLEFPNGFYHRNQGSYAMRTLNKRADNDYDIDIAVIFKESDLPKTAYEARKRIENAMKEASGNFARDPEALTNAVRVYYAEGYHVDMAIYREQSNGSGIDYEHAGSDWTRRDPMEITEWFNTQVDNLSPGGETVLVREGQLRRIVMYLKAFCRSRNSWSLPGGLFVTVLAVECYRPHHSRDDISLVETLTAIDSRLRSSTIIWNPVDPFEELASRSVDQARLHNFQEKASWILEKLTVLHETDCDRGDAAGAWGSFFNHDYWTSLSDESDMETMGEKLGDAAKAGSLFVTGDGKVSINPPTGKYIQSPEHRFYGDP
jgi:hypothetical protein